MTQEPQFEIIEAGKGKFIKAWKQGVEFDQATIQQLIAAAQLEIVTPWVAAMPDAHMGYGSTVGSVIPTEAAIIPAAVGVDIGCGMFYLQLELKREELPQDLKEIRELLEQAVPSGGPGERGSWPELVPQVVRTMWMNQFDSVYTLICKKHQALRTDLAMRQLGTLGTGNHFLELTEDTETGNVGILLHSGSRGLGNKIGTYFTKIAREYCQQNGIGLPERDLAYLPESTTEFTDYYVALTFTQAYAAHSRLLMMRSALRVLQNLLGRHPIERGSVHCHHNYTQQEEHQNRKLYITRKGAVRAGLGDVGIIPGSMGARSYVIRGKGSEHSFCSCSHGAGRRGSRVWAKESFTIEDHIRETVGVECDKTLAVLDETPQAYKDIEAVIAAQSDLIEVLSTMKQFVCVKGLGEERKWEKKKKRKKELDAQKMPELSVQEDVATPAKEL
jgi:tRNA-splicing ligase RtcB (3'-phosphate/5'-hydroxy nucleic acid ligase)